MCLRKREQRWEQWKEIEGYLHSHIVLQIMETEEA